MEQLVKLKVWDKLLKPINLGDKCVKYPKQSRTIMKELESEVEN